MAGEADIQYTQPLPVGEISDGTDTLLVNSDGSATVGLKAGSAIVGKVGIDQTTPGTTNAVQIVPGTSGGWSVYRSLSVLLTGLVVKASPGQLGGGFITNQAAYTIYVKIYDKATAATEADTPIMTIPILTGGWFNVSMIAGVPFAAGICIRCSKEVGDAGTTTPAANDCVANLLYK